MNGDSAGARSLILGRIRDILGERHETAAAEYARIGRDYQQTPTLAGEALIELFVDRLVHYQVTVSRCERAALPRAIADAIAARRKRRIVVPADIPREWLPAGTEFAADAGFSYADLDGSEGILTGCSLAIAVTGTIVLRHTAGEGRRAATLIPDYHLCVVHEDQVVHTVPEAMRRLAEWKPALVTTISGPSATADIEMTRIRGVHGPRTLDVVIAE